MAWSRTKKSFPSDGKVMREIRNYELEEEATNGGIVG